jgi:hypothetical protein
MRSILIATLCGLTYSALSIAQNQVLMNKSEVEALASKKVWMLQRQNDKRTVRWEFQADGYLFADNRTSPQRDKGKWSVNEKAQMCVKFSGASFDNCYAIEQVGDKYKLFSPGNMKNPASIATVQ